MLVRNTLLASLLSLLSFAAAARADTIVIDPDEAGISDGDDIANFWAGIGVTLSPFGGLPASSAVIALPFGGAITGTRVFGWDDGLGGDQHWGRGESPAFDVTLSGFLARVVSIEFETDGAIQLEAFGSGGSLGVVFAPGGTPIVFTSASNDILWFRVTITQASDFGTLDRLVITFDGGSQTRGAPVPEPATLLLVLAAGLPALLRRGRGVSVSRRRNRGEGALGGGAALRVTP